MAFRLHLLEHLGHASARIDHERRARDAPVEASPEEQPHPHAVALGDGVIGVGEQRKGQLILLLEIAVFPGRIGADTENDRIESLEPRERVANGARFSGSAGGVVLRVEKEDDGPAAELRERGWLVVVVGQRELGRDAAGGDSIFSFVHHGSRGSEGLQFETTAQLAVEAIA